MKNTMKVLKRFEENLKRICSLKNGGLWICNSLIGTVIFCSFPMVAVAQVSADPTVNILKLIEQNNLSLQAARENMKAEILDVKATNNLLDPEINYAHLFNSDRNSHQQSELTVVQGFEFPTTYIVRNNYNRLLSDAAQYGYLIERRNVLLQAKWLCLDLIGLNREADLLNMLVAHADSLVHLCEKRLHSGDADLLEVNRSKLGLMGLRAELADNAAAHRAALQELLSMNGNRYMGQMVGNEYPTVTVLADYEVLRDEVMPICLELQQAEAVGKAQNKRIAVSRQGWLPKLQVGFRRNTAPTEKFNGFVVGTSIPLFENKGKLKAARARSLSADLMYENLKLQKEADLQSLYNEACQLMEVMKKYDLSLLDSAFQLLDKALEGGELSWLEYFVEMEALTRSKLGYLKLENRYQKLIAKIYADKL